MYSNQKIISNVKSIAYHIKYSWLFISVVSVYNSSVTLFGLCAPGVTVINQSEKYIFDQNILNVFTVKTVPIKIMNIIEEK
jgi:hypothetical protein